MHQTSAVRSEVGERRTRFVMVPEGQSPIPVSIVSLPLSRPTGVTGNAGGALE